MQKCSPTALYIFQMYFFCLFFLSLTKRIRGFNTWIKKIFTADIQSSEVVMVPCFGTHKTRWAFQICSVNSQFKSAQSWIFSTLLFSKSFISFSIRATLYLSSWNFATGTWNRPFVLENMKGPFQELRLGQVCGLGTASVPSLLHFF